MFSVKESMMEYLHLHMICPKSPLMIYLVDVILVLPEPPASIADRFLLWLSSNCISISKSVQCVY